MVGPSLLVSWAETQRLAVAVAERWRPAGIEGVYGIPNGGHIPAAIVAATLDVPLVPGPTDPDTLIVDDLIDSGATIERVLDLFSGHAIGVDVLYRKPWSPTGLLTHEHAVPAHDGWIVFPWETGDDATGPGDAVRRLLEFIGDDPTRDGLVDTPDRVVRSLAELTDGYRTDIPALFTTFDGERHDEMIVVSDIPFVSLCEHHLLPFVGTAAVGYLPGPTGRIVGLSKIGRLVEAFARRLQNQERLTDQVADAMLEHLDPIGVGVVVRASHTCMAYRGIRKPSTMTTSALRGRMRDDPTVRAEFLDLAATHGRTA